MSKLTLADHFLNDSDTSKKEGNYNFRIDEAKKVAFDKLCKDHNTTPTQAFTKFIDSLLAEKSSEKITEKTSKKA